MLSQQPRASRSASSTAAPRIAIVIPCHDEQATIAKVVADFRRELPKSHIVVVDNASTDETASLASAAGALVVTESRRGKGHALLRGFREIESADLIVMVDGDDTYEAADVHRLIDQALRGADMVIGTRLTGYGEGAFPQTHTFGNRMFILMVRVLFQSRTEDLFSGYRVLTRRMLEHVPLIAQGFEIETELTLQALVGSFVVAETPVAYRARPEDSKSKLRTFRDGYRILVALIAFFRDYRPMVFFAALGMSLLGLGLWAGSYPVLEYFRTGQVQRLPLAVLAVGFVLLAAVAMVGGLILSSISRRSFEIAAIVRRAHGSDSQRSALRRDPWAE